MEYTEEQLRQWIIDDPEIQETKSKEEKHIEILSKRNIYQREYSRKWRAKNKDRIKKSTRKQSQKEHQAMLKRKGINEKGWLYIRSLGRTRAELWNCIATQPPGFSSNFESIDEIESDAQFFILKCQEEIFEKGYISIKLMGDFI